MFSLNRSGVSAGDRCEGFQFERGEVGHGVHLEVAPQGFDGIEFRSIRGKKEGMAMRPLVEEILNLSGSMGKETVPDQDKGRSQVAAKLSKEADDEGRSDIRIGMESEIEPEAIPLRADT